MLINKPPEVWGSYNRSGTSAADSTQDATNSRLFLRPAGIAPLSAYSTAPGRNLTHAAQISSVTFEATAISRAWPSNPNPVTSVQPATSNISIASQAWRFSVSIDSI